MPTLANLLDRMTIKVVSPDGNIRAGVSGPRLDMSLDFRPGSYHRYDDTTMEHQLAKLATLLWTGYQRGYENATAQAGLEVISDPVDDTFRAFLRGQSTITAHGESSDKTVRATSTGLLEWAFHIKPGSLSRLRENEFKPHLLEAARAVLNDHNESVERLRIECLTTIVANAPKI
ncbi:MAG TPA: hypothetical protein VE172_05210 [Stackebrandtia sp.]|jgi:hypothetical protein|uniref:hypothetical protein n=1 Tax=Stackebrandtia sp. TaxID=2023065 RepID=UPI002D4CB594|nr:hypothetical protein [Stackebrandtia sp.]HZE38193.1 hypothetical protein [Stackebrandtia sp.]